jgi:ABC-type Fe3+/spermidine/putrescine transport system ATPase subunit
LASVELRDLTKRFGPVTVVDNVSLRIDHGQLVCLLGPSGCGKTTTLRLIAGFHAAARAAQDVDDFPELRAVAAYDGHGEHHLWA